MKRNSMEQNPGEANSSSATQEFSAFYRTQRFTAAYRRAHHLSLS